MLQSSVPNFAELLSGARRTAVHLEMRDRYGVGDEVEEIERFTRTGQITLDPAASFWPQWIGIVKKTLARGVVMRRARIVSEPTIDYIRWEYAVTPLNPDTGEQVRWLPRRLASDIALPGNDFWPIDGCLAVFHTFTGDGDWADPGSEATKDPPP